MQSVSRCAVIRFKPNVYRTSVGYVRGFHKTSRNQHGGHSHGSPVFEQNEQARKACEKITKVGMITNGVLMIGKAAAGVFGGSHALIADAAHSLSDFGSDLVTLYVVNQVRKPHTPLYPYGFGRYEAIGSLAVGSILCTTSLGIMWSSASSLLHQFQEKFQPDGSWIEYLPEAHSHGIDLTSSGPASIAMAAAIISILSKEWVYRITMNVGEKFHSKVIIANAYHHRTDAYSSVIAVIGVGSSMILGVPWADTVAGLVVGAMVGKTAFSITKESIHELTDYDTHSDIREEVAKIINDVDGIINFHRLRIRKLGPLYALDLHITVDGWISVSAAHQLAEKVKHDISEKMERVTDILVHVDPEESAKLHQGSDKERYEIAQKKGTVHYVHGDDYLKRPQEEVKADIQKIIEDDERGYVKKITHFTCHFLNERIFVKMEVTIDKDLKISEASEVIKQLQSEILSKIVDIDHIDIHLELTEPTERK